MCTHIAVVYALYCTKTSSHMYHFTCDNIHLHLTEFQFNSGKGGQAFYETLNLILKEGSLYVHVHANEHKNTDLHLVLDITVY